MQKSRRKLKGVVFINQTLAMGGAEVFGYQLLNWFKKKNIPVRAWTTFSPQVRNLNAAGIETKKIPIVVDIIGDWKGFVKGVFLLPFAFIYYGILTYKNRNQGVLLMSGIERLFVSPWARLFGIPMVWIEHGPLDFLFHKFFGLFKALYKFSSKYPDFVVEPTAYVQNLNREVFESNLVRTRVIPSGINPLRSVNGAKQKFSAYCASRMEAGKGQDLLIAAWPKVIEEIPEAHLYILGDGDTKPALEKQVSDLGLTESITFSGWVKNDKVAEVIAPYTLGVFPSVWHLESFGVALAEAMSVGKAVICFNYGPYPEVVNRDCAILVDKGDIDGFSKAIIRVFQNPALAKKLGLAGKKRFFEYFSMSKVGEKYYETLLDAQTAAERRGLRWQVYSYDLKNKGLGTFFSDRIKKRRLLRKMFYLFRKPYVVIGKNKLFINKNDTVISESLMNKGNWEPPVTKVFSKYTKGAKLVVDAGANIGYYTVIASRLIKKGGQVISFEPSSYNFDLISKTVNENNLNGMVRLEKKALDAKESGAYLYLDEENYGDNRMYGAGTNLKKEKVETVSLDDYFSESGEKIDLLKMDVQGYELKALIGAKNLLRRRSIKVIILEFWPKGLNLAGDKWQDYIKFLKSNGFKLSIINGKGGKMILVTEEYLAKKVESDINYEVNILAVLK